MNPKDPKESDTEADRITDQFNLEPEEAWLTDEDMEHNPF